MKKILTILAIVFSITSISYAQSQSTIEILNTVIQIELPNTTVTGGNGTINMNISTNDMAATVGADQRLFSDIIKGSPKAFGEIFLTDFTKSANDDMYEVGIRKVRVYFILFNNTKIYGGAVELYKPRTINRM